MNWLEVKVKCNETPPVIDKDVNGERTICKHTVFFQQKRKMCSLMSNLGSCFLVKNDFRYICYWRRWKQPKRIDKQTNDRLKFKFNN